MIRKNVKWLIEKNKRYHIQMRSLKTKINTINKKSEYVKQITLNNDLNKKRKKNICLIKGKYKNNFSIFNLSRHYIKKIINRKLIFLEKHKW